MVEIVPAIERLPVEKMAPIKGVMRVVPQVGQPAPRAMRPVTIPAFSILAEFCSFFFFHNNTIRPMRIPCKIAIQKTGNQSRMGCPIPKIAKRFSPMMRRLPVNPWIRISSNFDRPPDKRFISKPKKRKLGMKPYQKRFSLVARRMPLLASANPSSHFLQFMLIIVAQMTITYYIFVVLPALSNDLLCNKT